MRTLYIYSDNEAGCSPLCSDQNRTSSLQLDTDKFELQATSLMVRGSFFEGMDLHVEWWVEPGFASIRIILICVDHCHKQQFTDFGDVESIKPATLSAYKAPSS